MINQFPSTSTISNDKIEDIINEIKIHKVKGGKEYKKKYSEGFPTLEHKIERSKKLNSIGSVDPWEG